MDVQPYLFFEGACEEAIEFYKRTVGAKVIMMMRYKENPDKSAICGSIDESKVMHSALAIGESTICASDGMCSGNRNFQGFSLSITAASDAEAMRIFTGLAEGGQIRMPMAKSFFASSFGMCADKFGVGWMVIVPLPMHK
jgi:PhnB protein